MSATTENEMKRAHALDGTRVANEIKREVAEEVTRFKQTLGITPGLVVVRVGEDPASAVYVRNKVRTSEELGISSEHQHLSDDITTQELLEIIAALNARADVDGVLVQLPLPRDIDESQVLAAIDPAKDVDGFHPVNVGRLNLGEPILAPCTPLGVIELLKREGVSMGGARACVVGRSHIVGRPLAALLLQHDATVTICHSRTKDLPSVTREADILIAAVGRTALIRGEHVKEGATVVDVGMNKVTDIATARSLFSHDVEQRVEAIKRRGYTLVGDVHPAEVERVAGLLTPVPGGIGPLTVAMLMRNTLIAAQLRRGI